MTTLTFMLMLQLVVSTKAGLVNHVQGPTNMKRMTQIPEGAPIRTNANGYAEVLLTPGSFLRLDENSEVVLDSVDIANVELHLVHGAAVIEVIEINKEFPIHVTTGSLIAEVFQEGIFRFEGGIATVIQGKLRTGDSKFVYDKGWQVFFQDNYRARKTGVLKPTSLDSYSQQRSDLIARANVAMLPAAQNRTWDSSFWFFSPSVGWFTFMPQRNYTSPYGYRFYGLGTIVVAGNSRNPGGSSGSSSNSGGASSGNNGTSGGSTDTSGGGGGGGGGGVVVSTPAGQSSSPGVYIGGKNTPAPATQR